MVLYNVTVKVEYEILDEWQNWMKQKHIPDVMKTGIFINNYFYKLLELDESDGVTFAIQYICETMNDLMNYQNKFAESLQKEHTERFEGKFVAFRTIMKSVD